MEEGVGTTRYWCHMCMQTVNPTREAELKCPLCHGGFIEQMASRTTTRLVESDLASDHSMSLWAPILTGMMGNTVNRQRFRQHLLNHRNTLSEDNENGEGRPSEGEIRSSAAFLQLLQGIINAGIEQEREREQEQEQERERVVLINPFNQTVVVQGSGNSNQGQSPFGSIGDFFIGHALDLLVQHLAENDPNRHGTLPAKREAVEALSTVKIEDDLQCPICLDEFEVCGEAKEMPCKHRFHGGCILPWLELHSSCPVCRFELPADGSKSTSEAVSRNGGQHDVTNVQEQGGSESSFLLPWPLNVFSQSSSSGAATYRPDGN